MKTGIICERESFLHFCEDGKEILEEQMDYFEEKILKSEKFQNKFEIINYKEPCLIETLLLVHTKSYIEKVVKAGVHDKEDFKETETYTDCPLTKVGAETFCCLHSPKILRKEINTLIELTEEVFKGNLKNGIMVGGGGHHAYRNIGEGFSVYNQGAIVATHLLDKFDKNLKILIFDWGNYK